MLWQGRRESENVEDVRGSGGRRLAVGGGIGGVILVVLYLLLGGDPMALLDSQQQAQLSQPGQIDNQAPRDEASKFVAVVLADTEDAWNEIFRQMGRQYEEPKLVLFTDQTRVRLRVRQWRERSVLLPGRSTRLHRPRFLPFTPATPGCRRRFRTGLRHSPRSWTSRAESARYFRSCAGGARSGQ